MRLALRRLAAGGGACGLGWYAARDVESAPARALRTLGYGSLVVVDYKCGASTRLPPDSEERRVALHETHERSAKRLLHVCRAHGGLFTKLGQFVASMNHVIPQPYTDVLAACQDRAPAVGFEVVRQVVEEELGEPIERIYSSFDESPIAAASLAQVHRAVCRSSGEPVAVKVQYPRLSRQVAADMVALRALAWAAERLFPGSGYEWLLPEFEQTLQQELDFTAEAANAARAAAAFAACPEVHVPLTLAALTSRRVLTMEFIDGAKLTDAAGIAALGLCPRELATAVSTAFSRMIFEDGFVHCDPHPGNLLARRMPAEQTATADTGGRWARYWGARYWGARWWRRWSSAPPAQLVLLDHGMYRQLSGDFVAAYSLLWHSLLTRDDDTGRDAAAALGVPPADYDKLCLLLTFRAPGSRTPTGARMPAAERARVRARFRSMTLADVSSFLEGMPRDLLFVMRTWALVRSLNRALGGTTRERLSIMGGHATVAVHRSPARGWAGGLLQAVRLRYYLLRAAVLMRAYDIAFALLWRLQALRPHSSTNLG